MMAKAKLLVGFFFVLLTLASLAQLNACIVTSAQYSTDVNSIVSVDTTWTKANSPYALSSPVTVSHGVNLTIEPGVTVNLNSFNLQVNGILYARGSSGNNIVFVSGTLGSDITFGSDSASWNEQAQSGCIIENSILQNVSLSMTNVSPKITNDTITAVHFGGHRDAIQVDTGAPVISGNVINGDILDLNEAAPTISNNSVMGGIYGQGLEDSEPVIVNNEIMNGDAEFGAGIFCNGNNIYVADNVIFNCTQGIIAADGSSIIERNLIQKNLRGVLISGPGNVSPTIINNTITDNIVGVEVTYDAPSITMAYNNIEDNMGFLNSTYEKHLGYDFFLYGEETENITAINNYWGTTNDSIIQQTIYDSENSFYTQQKGYGVVGVVTFTPFLNKPNPEALPRPAQYPTPSPMPSPTATAPNSPSPSESVSPASTPPSETVSPAIPSAAHTLPPYVLYAVITVLAFAVAGLAVAVFVLARRKK